MYRVAINGFGRIGRNVLRAFFERKACRLPFEIVAINDLGCAEVNAHLLKHDTVHGKFNRTVEVTRNEYIIGGKRITYLSQRDVNTLPWEALDVDLVLECTGIFTSKEAAGAHLAAGAKRVLVSAPAKGADATIVYGVNHHILNDSHKVISNASCTTNCLAPIVDVLEKEIGIESGLVTTVHAFTNDQSLTDSYHSDPRRARSATQSMIPTKTGAASAIGEVIPTLNGKLDGLAVRVPVINTSLLDLTATLKCATSVAEINELLRSAAYGRLLRVLAFNELPLVSHDFNHHPASSIVDGTQTKVLGRQAKILAWYDNEWGFANRMLDTSAAICKHNARSLTTDIPHSTDTQALVESAC